MLTHLTLKEDRVTELNPAMRPMAWARAYDVGLGPGRLHVERVKLQI